MGILSFQEVNCFRVYIATSQDKSWLPGNVTRKNLETSIDIIIIDMISSLRQQTIYKNRGFKDRLFVSRKICKTKLLVSKDDF